jgi:pilus assembly protein CpaB
MKPKTMILLVVAVGCGLGASYMTSKLLAERANATEEEEKVNVLVAKKIIETGATLKNPTELFEEKPFIRGTEPKSAIVNLDDLKGKVLKHSLREGDYVSSNDLMSDKESYMAWMLPPGHRAIGLRVNIESIAGGFASLPLSRVDIISTVRRGDDKSSYSQVLLQNVLVLAADQAVERESKQAMPATTVTVALKPEEVLRVTLAKELGPLSLVLRKFNDNQKVDLARVTFEDITSGGAKKSSDVTETMVGPTKIEPKIEPKVEPKKVEPLVTAPKTKTWVVTVINSDQQQQVEYTFDEHDEVISTRLLPLGGLPRADSLPPPVQQPQSQQQLQPQPRPQQQALPAAPRNDRKGI